MNVRRHVFCVKAYHGRVGAGVTSDHPVKMKFLMHSGIMLIVHGPIPNAESPVFGASGATTSANKIGSF